MAKPSIPGHQRVAALLLSLEPDERAKLLKTLKPDVVELVAQAMMELDSRLSDEGVVDKIKDELARSLHGSKVVNACDSGTLEQLLTSSFGPQSGQQVMQAISERRKGARPFFEVEPYSAFEIGRVLRNESAAVCALVLAYLAPEMTADVLKIFPKELAVDVLQRMVKVNPPKPDVLQAISANVLQQLKDAPPVIGEVDPSMRLKNVADVLNQSAPEMEKDLMAILNEDDAEVAQELREFMFTWEDIAGIDKRTMQKILGMVDTKTLSVALKGCSEEVEQNILGNLSSRVADMVAEERELAGPMPMNEVQVARDEVMKNIRALIEAGEFRPSKGGEELVA